MSTKLALIALTGFALSIACLGAATALDGRSIIHSISFGDFDLPRCDLSPTGQTATRSLAWDGSDSAGIAVPATVHYRRGQSDHVVVTGDSALVPHVEVTEGSVRLNCRARSLNGMRLDVTLPGREFKDFSLAGTGNVTLENLHQSDLGINMAGPGQIAASGNVEMLSLHVAGAGDAKLDGLAVERVKLDLAGTSHIDVAPKDDLKANIVGSGTITLHSEPHSIETHIIGSGRIVHPDGAVSGRHI